MRIRRFKVLDVRVTSWPNIFKDKVCFLSRESDNSVYLHDNEWDAEILHDVNCPDRTHGITSMWVSNDNVCEILSKDTISLVI